MIEALFATVIGDEVEMSICVDVHRAVCQMVDLGVSCVVFYAEHNGNFYTVILAEGDPQMIGRSMSMISQTIGLYIEDVGEDRLRDCLTTHPIEGLKGLDNDLE